MLNYNKQKFLLLDGIDKETIDALRGNYGIIAGGAIRSVFGGEYISDYDIYAIDDLWLRNIKVHLNNNYEMAFESPTATSYKKDKIKIQLVIMPSMITDSIDKLLSQFDFTICMGAYDFKDEKFILNENFLPDLSRKELKFNVDAKYPLASLFRIRKFLKRGYKISGTEIIKIGLSINNLKIDNYVTLKEQLHGIDTLFLKDLTDKLLAPEYAEKQYDFNEFLKLLDWYDDRYLDTVME